MLLTADGNTFNFVERLRIYPLNKIRKGVYLR